ncbi:hypothetical protein [Candidatus Accumulibacter sp. ACC012]|uniref:hypothetical protein n=1 Tax=Candidatus Accumulibacter sp. ACC012 TaxID=2823332 RepID=UPI0025C250BD|nr:hypothetical protein [Candidatus Accumulibacter sp. ACC012]
METIEATAASNSAVIPFLTITDTAPTTKTEAYEAVRFNAMKHGILSKLAVLAHEDHAEFDDLLAALIDEHRPAGITERHLIEELATIIWRKRRVLLAEGAKINEGLKAAVSNPALVMTTAAPFQRGLSGKGVDLRDLLDATPQEMGERQREAENDLAATRKAGEILRKGGANAYQAARRALSAGLREWWDVRLSDDEGDATAESFAEFVRDELHPFCISALQEVRFTPAIKAQTLGEGVQAYRLEKLNRYETHLDRKFERTLAMLLKLKDLRVE